MAAAPTQESEPPVIFKALKPLLSLDRPLGLSISNTDCNTGKRKPVTVASFLKTGLLITCFAAGFTIQARNCFLTYRRGDIALAVGFIPWLFSYWFIMVLCLPSFRRNLDTMEFWERCKRADDCLRRCGYDVDKAVLVTGAKRIYVIRGLLGIGSFCVAQAGFSLHGYGGTPSTTQDHSALWYIDHVLNHLMITYTLFCTFYLESKAAVIAKYLADYYEITCDVITLALTRNKASNEGLQVGASSNQGPFIIQSRTAGNFGLVHVQGAQRVTLAKAWEVYENTRDLIKCFNKSVGGFILLEHIAALINIICLIYAPLKGLEGHHQDIAPLLYLSLAVFMLAHHAMLSFFCSQLAIDSRKPERILCYQLSRNWLADDESPYMARSFMVAVSRKHPGVSAWGCFIVKRSSFFTFLSLVITYIAVIWQNAGKY